MPVSYSDFYFQFLSPHCRGTGKKIPLFFFGKLRGIDSPGLHFDPSFAAAQTITFVNSDVPIRQSWLNPEVVDFFQDHPLTKRLGRIPSLF